MADTYTPNLNLKKPGYDSPADIADINANMDKIDTSVNQLSEQIVNDYVSKEEAGLVLLWQNASPESNCEGGTTIAFNGTNFKKIVLIWKIDTANNNYGVTEFVRRGLATYVFFTTGDLSENWTRSFTVSSVGLNVGRGRKNNVENNSVIIPYEVYGGKY